MADSTQIVTITIEKDIWEPAKPWERAISDLAKRFSRLSTLDVNDLLAIEDFNGQVSFLSSWANAAGVDLNRELGRWFDENLALHMRPDPDVTRKIRAAALEGSIYAKTVLPPRAAESILRHAGVWRSITELNSNYTNAS